MTRRQHKINRYNILQKEKDCQSSPHDLQCNVTPPNHKHTQHKTDGPDNRAQEGSSSVARSPKNCLSLSIHHMLQLDVQKIQWRLHVVFRTRKAQTHKPLPGTNSDFPTEIIYWSRVTLCNLYYSIPRFSGVGILFTDVRPSPSMFPWNRSRTPQQNQC